MADNSSRSGTAYYDTEIRAFVDRVHAPHDEALERAFRAPEAHQMPAIQVSASEGRLLELLVQLSAARRIVEVGTLAGYSALRMARAMHPGGMLHTLELEPKHAEIARENITAAQLDDRVRVHVGDARERLATLVGEGPFDLVFLDADKGSYPDYLQWAAQNLRPGGLLLADNAHYFGALLKHDPTAAAMRRFHEQVPQWFDSVCIPTPDGMVLGIRRA